jgi:uncharacterized RDD family membrane protein YckC
MEIYLSQGGERVGPYALEEINRRLAAGTLNPSDLGWSETSPGWKPLVSFVGVIMPGGASSTPLPLRIATPIAGHTRRYAGFWVRTAAYLIDAFIVVIFALVIATLFRRSPEEPVTPSGVGAILQLLIFIVYMPALWSSPMQATIGQRICVLRVIHAIDGGGISFARGLLRFLEMVLSGLFLGIGFIMVAFTERKRGLHDMIADTCVVKDSPVDRWLTEARANLAK